MLKLLKKTWKEGEANKSQSPQGITPTLSNDSFSSDNTTIAGHESSMIADATATSGCRSKRSRPSLEPETNDPSTSERPSKLLKTATIDDFLRNHLPEVVDSRDRDEHAIPLNLFTLREQILEQSKCDNTIAVLPPEKSSTNLLVQYLSWAIETEKSRFSRNPLRLRTALFVVDDSSTIHKYYDILETGIPSISLGRYEEKDHRPEIETWTEMLKRDVVIAPSELLLDSLLRGALAVTQIHALIISDAQNIKNQDSHTSLPIVQVMNDFYRVTDPLSRPRVFALAATPTDRRSHFDSKMLKLEQTLDARVFGITAEKRAEILALPDRPNELVILYDTPQQLTETRLSKQLHQLDPAETVFRRHYRDSRRAHEEVGPCAYDLVWRRALKEIESGVMPWYEDSDEDSDESPSTNSIKSRMRGVVKNWAYTMPNLDSSSRGFNVSHKFLRLVQVLATFSSYGDGFRGIIFVQRRAIALVLADLLRMLDDRLGFLRPQAVVGASQSSDPEYYRETFHSFATGVCNLLIATKSLEDLEVPRASMVVRYDLFESQVSHAYVRARTRGRESHLLHMVERGNDVHRRILSRITNLDADMLRWTETLCDSSESSVPPSSLRETINPYHSDSEDEDEVGSSADYIMDPTTSGRIYLQDATTVLYRYAANLRSKGVTISDNQRLFEFGDIHKGFGMPRDHMCTLNLPGTPVDKIQGSHSSSKAQARRSACFKACKTLFETGSLECRLVPLPTALRIQERQTVPEKEVPSNQKTSGTRSYPRKQPDFWTNTSGGNLTTLYPTVIYTGDAEKTSGEYSPMAILTRKPLPEFATFRLFSSGLAIPIRFQKAAPIHLDEARLKDMHLYTLRICRATMNKPLFCSLEDMLYFFLPLPSKWRPPVDVGLEGPPVILGSIPWDLVSLAAGQWAVPIKSGSPQELEDDLNGAIIQDRWIEFTRRYSVVKVRKDLTPLSKPPDSQREAHYENLFEFCKSKRKGLDSLTNYKQPVIEVAKVPAILNHLNPTFKLPSDALKYPAKYLIPELCAKFTLPASIYRTAMLLPSIMRRIDDFLIVKELDAKLFDNVVREDLLHVAICTPSAGLEYDYERLELLGDAFLKYLSSIYLFVTNPSLNEGSLHVARQKIISNKSLLQHSTRVGLPAYIQSKEFGYKSWQPPNFHVYFPPKPPKDPESRAMQVSRDEEMVGDAESSMDSQNGTGLDAGLMMDASSIPDEKNVPLDSQSTAALEPGELAEVSSGEILLPGVDVVTGPPTPTAGSPNVLAPKKKQKGKRKKASSDKDGVQWLADKAIADVAEAIIGAAYISGGREAALQVTKALTIPVSNIDRWSDFGRKVLTPLPNITAKLRQGSIAAIEKIIGHKFNIPHLLGQAMTHSSTPGYESTSYERLEFIGDAILDFMVIRHIYDRDQQLSPGALTMLKGAMVSNSALAAVCVWSGLHEHLLFDSSQLASSIQGYANELQDRQDKEYALAKQEGRSVGQYWLDIEPPKALSDLVESIIGAIYISDNFSPVGVESMFDSVLKPFYDKHITLHTLSHHPTKILFELFQAQGCQQFEITKDKDEDRFRCHVLVHEVILASGEDTTPTLAARQASLLALDALEGDADFLTRTCDCRTHITHKKLHKKTAFEQALERALSKAGEETENPQDNKEDEEDEEEEFEERLDYASKLTGYTAGTERVD
ncbi:hypothetical protein B0H34DRAFT_689150 [Crassisporium funariophilum]|nr:hypothetical protein B0H34DRAFT_689150 [Crassisporium funariophilum]